MGGGIPPSTVGPCHDGSPAPNSAGRRSAAGRAHQWWVRGAQQHPMVPAPLQGDTRAVLRATARSSLQRVATPARLWVLRSQPVPRCRGGCGSPLCTTLDDGRSLSGSPLVLRSTTDPASTPQPSALHLHQRPAVPLPESASPGRGDPAHGAVPQVHVAKREDEGHIGGILRKVRRGVGPLRRRPAAPGCSGCPPPEHAFPVATPRWRRDTSGSRSACSGSGRPMQRPPARLHPPLCDGLVEPRRLRRGLLPAGGPTGGAQGHPAPHPAPR